eukprot:Opistho-2@35177
MCRMTLTQMRWRMARLLVTTAVERAVWKSSCHWPLLSTVHWRMQSVRLRSLSRRKWRTSDRETIHPQTHRILPRASPPGVRRCRSRCRWPTTTTAWMCQKCSTLSQTANRFTMSRQQPSQKRRCDRRRVWRVAMGCRARRMWKLRPWCRPSRGTGRHVGRARRTGSLGRRLTTGSCRGDWTRRGRLSWRARAYFSRGSWRHVTTRTTMAVKLTLRKAVAWARGMLPRMPLRTDCRPHPTSRWNHVTAALVAGETQASLVYPCATTGFGGFESGWRTCWTLCPDGTGHRRTTTLCLDCRTHSSRA